MLLSDLLRRLAAQDPTRGEDAVFQALAELIAWSPSGDITETLKRFKSLKSLRSYLFVAARHRLIDERRSSASSPSVEEASAKTADPSTHAENEEILELLRNAIEGRGPIQLTAKERRVLELLLEGMSQSEIAAALNVAKQTVHVTVGRIMTKVGTVIDGSD